MNQFPPSPRVPYCITTVSNFLENSRRYSQVKEHQRYQRHRWQICQRCQRHRRQNCCRYQRHQWQIFPPVSLVLLIPVTNLPPVSVTPVANLPPVSTTPVANCHRYQRRRLQICLWCQRHPWQIIVTISGCSHLKGTVSRDFLLQVFFMNHLPPSPW